MYQNIHKLLSIIALLFILSGCGASNLSYHQQQLIIEVDETYLNFNGKQVKIFKDNYGSLSITQKVLRLPEGDLLVYEEALCDSEYEFEPGIAKSIKVIFDVKDVIIVYAKNGFYGYQLILNEGKILNLVAKQEAQVLKMMYGMTSTRFDMLLKALDPNSKKPYYQNVLLIKENKQPILSKWDAHNVHFYPLVVSLPKISGM